jgi:acetoacetyl-CoA synthetase
MQTVVGGAPNLPVHAGWCQARALGMKLQIYSDEGHPIETTGQAGELVCTAPFPSQPAFFWGDEEGTRYKSAYFEKFSGIAISIYQERITWNYTDNA